MTDTYAPVLTDEQIVQVRRSMRPWQMMDEYDRASLTPDMQRGKKRGSKSARAPETQS